MVIYFSKCKIVIQKYLFKFLTCGFMLILIVKIFNIIFNLSCVVNCRFVGGVVHLQVVASDYQSEVNAQKNWDQIPGDNATVDVWGSETSEEHDDVQHQEDHGVDQVRLYVTALVLVQTNKEDNGECEEQDKEDQQDADDGQRDGTHSLCAVLLVSLSCHHSSRCQADDRHQYRYYVTDQV